MSSVTTSDPLSAAFSITRTPKGTDLHKDVTAAIAEAIWAQKVDGEEGKGDVLNNLAYWFRYYQDETTSTTALRPSNSSNAPIRTHAELLSFVQLLKQNPQTPRADLKTLWQKHRSQVTNEKLDIDGALHLAVRLMFMTACRLPAEFNIVHTGQIFKPIWKDQDSLTQFVESIFPQYDLNLANGAELIRTEKFSARYLKEYADVQLAWTNHLPDHLILQRTNDGKYLYVFSHAGFLEICSQASEKGQPNGP